MSEPSQDHVIRIQCFSGEDRNRLFDEIHGVLCRMVQQPPCVLSATTRPRVPDQPQLSNAHAPVDIVTALRDHGGGTMDEAADEIERLRSMIADYSAVPFQCDDCRRKLTVEEVVTDNGKP